MKGKINILMASLLIALGVACSNTGGTGAEDAKIETSKNTGDPIMPDTDTHKDIKPIHKSDAEWQKELSEAEFKVARKGGTEPAFHNRYWDNHKAGTYNCVCCKLPLFSSETKFESGTGWPSFYMPIADKYVEEKSDRSFGMVRTEARCARCGAHLGHVFDDGPKPTGLRYCMNSLSLDFEPEK